MTDIRAIRSLVSSLPRPACLTLVTVLARGPGCWQDGHLCRGQSTAGGARVFALRLQCFDRGGVFLFVLVKN